ncbi:hypothetical protein EDC01DRAFT_776895 [Geopyxis carbonaria]|nr:hypothetical protein EDC01DRAFT_776895 [Geopyxis carbonaria]
MALGTAFEDTTSDRLYLMGLLHEAEEETSKAKLAYFCLGAPSWELELKMDALRRQMYITKEWADWRKKCDKIKHKMMNLPSKKQMMKKMQKHVRRADALEVRFGKATTEALLWTIVYDVKEWQTQFLMLTNGCYNMKKDSQGYGEVRAGRKCLEPQWAIMNGRSGKMQRCAREAREQIETFPVGNSEPEPEQGWMKVCWGTLKRLFK